MFLTFAPLEADHFPLLLKWLETPHVKVWWDSRIKWTPKLIQKKYDNYVKNCKLMNAYIFCVDHIPIGYIQCYNKYDFPREHDYLIKLPKACAAIDWYIGEPAFISRGIGTMALKKFLDSYVFPSFDSVFVDPDTANVSAIRAYEKAGFKVLKKVNDDKVTLMLRKKG